MKNRIEKLLLHAGRYFQGFTYVFLALIFMDVSGWIKLSEGNAWFPELVMTGLIAWLFVYLVSEAIWVILIGATVLTIELVCIGGIIILGLVGNLAFGVVGLIFPGFFDPDYMQFGTFFFFGLVLVIVSVAVRFTAPAKPIKPVKTEEE